MAALMQQLQEHGEPSAAQQTAAAARLQCAAGTARMQNCIMS